MPEFLKLIFENTGIYLKKIQRIYYLPLGLGIVGLILFIYGLIQYIGVFQNRENSQAGNFTDNSSFSPTKLTISQIPMISPSAKLIAVDVEGAVQKSGLYQIPQDSRVQDALIAAGGIAAGADRGFVEKNINLAEKLADGMKIYVPRINETQIANLPGQNQSSMILGADSQSNIISVNSASANQLDTLPGIGPATAQKIISHRPYGSLDDLLNRKSVSQKVFDKIKTMISL